MFTTSLHYAQGNCSQVVKRTDGDWLQVGLIQTVSGVVFRIPLGNDLYLGFPLTLDPGPVKVFGRFVAVVGLVETIRPVPMI